MIQRVQVLVLMSLFQVVVAGAQTDAQSDMSERPLGGCLTSGTKVSTPRGPRAIETLHSGDTVYSFDVTTQTVIENQIVRLIETENRDAKELVIGGEQIWVTDNHPFYPVTHSDQRVLEEGYQEIGKIPTGSELFAVDFGSHGPAFKVGAVAVFSFGAQAMGKTKVYTLAMNSRAPNFFVQLPNRNVGLLVRN